MKYNSVYTIRLDEYECDILKMNNIVVKRFFQIKVGYHGKTHPTDLQEKIAVSGHYQ